MSAKLKWRRGEPTAEERQKYTIIHGGNLSVPSPCLWMTAPGHESELTWWPNTWFLVLDIGPVEVK